MSSFMPHANIDVEAQTQPINLDQGSRSGSPGASDIRDPTPHHDSSHHSNSTSSKTNESGHNNTAELVHDVPRANISSLHFDIPPSADEYPTQSEWTPLKPNEPFFTQIPESKDVKEDWVKAMGKADDGMCRGWKDQIDTLIIFAGLFSATVTAFTIESYQWLDETPANTLARLQLRDLLNITHDPTMNHLAPATFHVSSVSVVINTLWFTSLTFSLAAVVVSILCKQWLHEYQRYDNFTVDEAFLIRGVRHRGLQAWRVPEIISFLPILLQIALVLFLAGILTLLWSLQTVVASFTTLIVGVTFIFLVITTILPSIQYIYPTFETQCAYKSSQSWSFFVISAFWLFNFSEFTSWGSIDQWEINNVHNGLGQTLSWVYRSFRNSNAAFLSLYNILADKSLNPTFNENLAVLPDFIDELSTSGLPDANGYNMKRALSLINDTHGPYLPIFGRLHNLRTPFRGFLSVRRQRSRLRPQNPEPFHPGGSSLVHGIDIPGYYPRIQAALYHFLRYSGYSSNPVLFNRSIEHWARSFRTKNDIMTDSKMKIPQYMYDANIPYDPEITRWLIGFHTHVFQESLFPIHMVSSLIFRCYPKLIESHRQHNFDPPPAVLLEDIQEWIRRVPESALNTKTKYANHVLYPFFLSDTPLETFAGYHTVFSEKQSLISFMRFFLDLFQREEIRQAVSYNGFWYINVLESFQRYLDQNAAIPLSSIDQNGLPPESPKSIHGSLVTLSEEVEGMVEDM